LIILNFLGALDDLDTAILLATQYRDTKVLALALAQKGTILRLKSIQKLKRL